MLKTLKRVSTHFINTFIMKKIKFAAAILAIILVAGSSFTQKYSPFVYVAGAVSGSNITVGVDITSLQEGADYSCNNTGNCTLTSAVTLTPGTLVPKTSVVIEPGTYHNPAQ